jgi:nucleotide-binding universal stress UspA family protein
MSANGDCVTVTLGYQSTRPGVRTEDEMSISKIVVPVTGSKRDGVALRTAIAAARPFHAHVAALFVHPDVRETIPYVGVPLSPQVIQDLVDSAEEIARAAAKSARAALAAAADEAKVRILAAPERSDAVTASYTEKTGHFVSCLEDAALLCDLIVFPPIGHGDNPDVHDGFTRILTKSQRPVLLSPEAAPTQLGRRIAFGWDGGPAAAHALTAALPYLKKADSVHIVSIRRAHGNAGDIDAVKSYLALHVVVAVADIVEGGERAGSDLLLQHALSSNCDLLVMGGYGHSRIIETMLGGVTQRIASQPGLPVFMMH